MPDSTGFPKAETPQGLLDSAIVLARLGCSVIPIRPREKRPLLNSWAPYQKQRATEEQIRDWWTTWPDANPAIVTGAVSGLVVLDVDGEVGMSSLKGLPGLPPTVSCKTPRGIHYFYRHPGREVRNPVGLRPGLDVRGDGGYVVAAGSISASGAAYAWFPGLALGEHELAPMPEWLGETPKKSDAHGNGNGPHSSGKDSIQQGTRNATLASLAGSMRRRGMSKEAILCALLAENKARCVPLLDESEVGGIAESIGRYPTEVPQAPGILISREGAESSSETSLPIPWPRPLDGSALYGLAGDIVRAIEPHTESDPVALLAQILAAFGNVVGRNPYFPVEADKHYPNLFVVLVGASSRGRKGTSWGHVRRMFSTMDAGWGQKCLKEGLSSGEGLIWNVRDPIERTEPIKGKGKVKEYETVIADPGVEDKRLLIFEGEFASALRVLGREGNTLSAVLRNAWDTGDLRVLTKNTPAQATGAHVSVIAHITQSELLRYLDNTETGNGFANRFLWLCTRRSRVLPEGGRIAEVDFAPLLRRLTDAAQFARTTGGMTRDDKTRTLWAEVYERLTEGLPGLLGAVTARAEAQVLRLSCLYALLDQSSVVKAEHLGAALALWRYAHESAAFIFGDALGDPLADEILRALRANPDGLTRSQISGHFGRNRDSRQIARALSVLAEHGLARTESRATDGRSAEVWLTPRTKQTKEEGIA